MDANVDEGWSSTLTSSPLTLTLTPSTSSTGAKLNKKRAALIEQLKLSVKKFGNQLWLKVALIGVIVYLEMMEVIYVSKKHTIL